MVQPVVLTRGMYVLSATNVQAALARKLTIPSSASHECVLIVAFGRIGRRFMRPERAENHIQCCQKDAPNLDSTTQAATEDLH